jgi:multiple sugar transport system substrate-binding protein
MTAALVFSVMHHSEETLPSLRKVFDNTASGIGLNLSYVEIDFETGWRELRESAIHAGRMDVSEVGSTWINDFIIRNALFPFSPAELSMLGAKEEAYPACLWKSGMGANGEIWAIPWMTDLSLVYYRRDLLRAAKVKERGAFSNPARFTDTLARLSQINVATPWVVPTRRSYITIHNIAMWLWAHGIDYLDPAGQRIMLVDPAGRQALRAYFGLCCYLARDAQRLAERQADSMFIDGNAAVTISGPWLLPECQRNHLNIGVAVPMGQSFIGGSSLVIWNPDGTGDGILDTDDLKREPLKLIDALAGSQMQASLPSSIGMFPARLALLKRLPNTGGRRFNRIIVNALKTGRSFPHIPLWGIIEDKLSDSFERVWAGLLSTSAADLDLLIEQHIVPEVNILNAMLKNSSS